jgi:hypothetical protein
MFIKIEDENAMWCWMLMAESLFQFKCQNNHIVVWWKKV